MTSDRWDRIAQIYQTAAALPHEARAAYLDEACRADAALRHDVDSLFAQAGVPVLSTARLGSRRPGSGR